MAKYALLEVTLTSLIGALLTWTVGAWAGWWAILPLLLTLALLSFYRDPPRAIPQGDHLLLSPADGRIMRIERNYRATPDAAPELRIVIFLSVLNVHVNRAPCAARVESVEYTPGEFLNALKPEATERNERNLITLTPRAPLPGPIRVRQIAGLLAKRIVCALRPGDEVLAGERFGMIKLGSQTELRAPESPDWRLEIAVGQRVAGGLTVLARYEKG